MTPDAVLREVLDRVGALSGAAVLFSERELLDWPHEAVAAMKSQGLLTKAGPSKSAICPGCERECVMPVHLLACDESRPEAFIVCDKRTDVNRVPISLNCLEQWQISGDSVADLLADLLGLHRSRTHDANLARSEIGVLKGVKHSGHLVLIAKGRLVLAAAGHEVPLYEVLSLDDGGFKLDKQALIRRVDHPVAAAGDSESAAQRRDRLKARVEALRRKGIRAFLKVVAEEEGISVSRLKQLIH